MPKKSDISLESYSIGSILSKMMKIISDDDLNSCLVEQSKMSEDEVLGQIMIAKGYIDADQLSVALEAQKGLRSLNRKKRALAMANVARISSKSVVNLVGMIRNFSTETREEVSGGNGMASEILSVADAGEE